MLLSPMDTSETVIALANAKGELHATSARKIERAEVSSGTVWEQVPAASQGT